MLSPGYVISNNNDMNLQGKFNLTITEFQLCKGPKQKDCAISKAVVVNGSTVEYDLDVLQNISPTKVSINVNDLIHHLIKCFTATGLPPISKLSTAEIGVLCLQMIVLI